VTFPVASPTSPLPFELWAHGWGGSHITYTPVAEAHAKAGVVVFQPEFPDSPVNEDGPQESDFAYYDERVLEMIDLWSAIRDGSFPYGDACPAIDATRGLVGGHSFGSDTVSLCGGVEYTDGRGVTRINRLPDLKGIILLSGQGVSPPRTTQDSFRSITAPMLVMTGTNDPARGFGGPPRPWHSRLDPFRLTDGDFPSYCAVIRDGDHGYGSVTESDNPNQVENEDWKEVTLNLTTSFASAYLHDDSAALGYLGLPQEPALAYYLTRGLAGAGRSRR
jgi:hypothetical protein